MLRKNFTFIVKGTNDIIYNAEINGSSDSYTIVWITREGESRVTSYTVREANSFIDRGMWEVV